MGEANAQLIEANSRLEEATKNLFLLANAPLAREQAKAQLAMAEKMEQAVAVLEKMLGIAEKKDRNPFLDQIEAIGDMGFFDREDKPFPPFHQPPRNPLR